MRSSLRAAVTAVFLLSSSVVSWGQTTRPVPRANAVIWQDVAERTVANTIRSVHRHAPRRDIVPRAYRTVQLNKSGLKELLATAPPEAAGPADVAAVEIQLPLPSGGFEKFLVQESPIMEPKLSARYPELKTYAGQSSTDAGTTVRIDFTPRGFHAVVLSTRGQFYIDPYSRETDAHYISYYKRDFAPANKPFSCFVEGDPTAKAVPATSLSTQAARPSGATLRTYRLALACTGEYAASVCNPDAPTTAATLAAMVTSVNRCSAVYEREFAIRFVLVNNTDKLVYLDGSSDPYTNSTPNSLLSQNQSNIDNVIGSANYDFGHVFSTGGGGLASRGVVCVAGQKARGETGTTDPVGDPYDIDFVVHEMGHQFGANHPFNGTSGNCSGSNRNASTAYEPGSGTTIMAYAGICSPQDLAPHSDDYFHTINYDEIDSYTSGTGATCAQTNSTGNTPPSISAVASATIPIQTPFALTASANDVDGDILSYCWEEFDLGGAQDPTAAPRDNGSSPIFRSFPPTTNPTRYFPSLIYILNNTNVPPAIVAGFASGEVLPSTSRTMTFRATVRDNHAGGGGSNYISTTVTSTTAAGPFVVTAPNASATFAAGSQINVAWNVANTTAAPVSCANVKITLSTDGGNTFPIVLANSLPNNGSALVTIPNTANVATNQGRIKVQAVGNIFFDISDADLTITSTQLPPSLTINNSLTIVRGKLTATVAAVAAASDAFGGAVTAAVSNLPFGAHVTPSVSNGTVTLSATVDCSLVTTLSSRTYPITLTVTDSNGSTSSGTVNLNVMPNPSPTLGAYPDINVGQNTIASSSPASAAADANGNLQASPYSIIPTTLPGGGSLSVNQATGAVTATTTAGTTLGTTSLRVTVLDTCGAAAMRILNVNVLASTTPILQAGNPSSPTAESCGPANGAVDPGETVTLNLPIVNTGSAATQNLIATLQSSGGVTPITTSQNYGAVNPNATVSRSFQFSASGACGGTITATLQLSDGATDFGLVTYTIRLGLLPVSLSENFDAISPPALPPGWNAVVTQGAMTPWATDATSPDTTPNSVSATTVPSVSDNQLTSASMGIPSGSSQLSFRHRWNLETGFDGGILEISVNGGPFTEIIAAGGSFISGPYTGSISTNYGSPIGGASAWTGGANNGYTTTVVSPPASATGQNARFRWRLACDESVSVSGAIWRIDSIVLTSSTYVCTSCSSPPAIQNGPPPSQVIVGTPYSFTFVATGNPAPTFSIKSGTLPAGISLSSSGVLSGTATAAGTGSFPNITIAATNGNAPDAQQMFSLNAVTRAANYLSSYGLTGADAGFNFDYDHDGMTNLLEYALHLDPTMIDISGLPVVFIKSYSGTSYLSMTFNRSSLATDLTYTVQGSADLVTWTDLASSIGGSPTMGAGVIGETGPAPNFSVEVRDSVPVNSAPAGKRFMRLKITSQ